MLYQNNFSQIGKTFRKIGKIGKKNMLYGFAASLEACARSPTLLPVQALGIESTKMAV